MTITFPSLAPRSVGDPFPLRPPSAPSQDTVAPDERFHTLRTRADPAVTGQIEVRLAPLRIDGRLQSADAVWEQILPALEDRAISARDIGKCHRAFCRTLQEGQHEIAQFGSYEALAESLVVALNARYGRNYGVSDTPAAPQAQADGPPGFQDYSLAGKFAFILAFLGALPGAGARPARPSLAPGQVQSERVTCDAAVPADMRLYPNLRQDVGGIEGYRDLGSDPDHLLARGTRLQPGPYLFAWDPQTKCIVFAEGNRNDPGAIFQNPLVHPDLVNGRPVYAAGEFTVNEDGKIDSLSNLSGHYRPRDRLVLADNCTVHMDLPTLTHVSAHLQALGQLDANARLEPFDDEGRVRMAQRQCEATAAEPGPASAQATSATARPREIDEPPDTAAPLNV